jgi:hypothetical protein
VKIVRNFVAILKENLCQYSSNSPPPFHHHPAHENLHLRIETRLGFFLL